MKPEQWAINDIKAMRAITQRNATQEAYLSLLAWYIRVMQGRGE